MRFYKQYDLATENFYTCRNPFYLQISLFNRSPIYTHTTIPDLHVVDDIPIPIPIEYSYDKDLIFLHAWVAFCTRTVNLRTYHLNIL